MDTNEMINHLPFAPPFLFVDELLHVDEKGARGSFTYHKDQCFYKGHFIDYPVTPGTILVETMTQIGGAPLILFLEEEQKKFGLDTKNLLTVATSFESVDFYKPVYPNTTVFVQSEIIYFRFGKLKYKATMKDDNGDLIAKGIFTGMVKNLKEDE